MLYRWERPPVDGLINPSEYLNSGQIEWITVDGRLQLSPLQDCKALCFVSEAGKGDLFTVHNLFERRPRVQGLWTRFAFRDGGMLDGILSHNLLDWPEAGYLAVPPQARANRQRVFIPRTALTSTELLGVVGAGSAFLRKGDRIKIAAGRQISMFD